MIECVLRKILHRKGWSLYRLRRESGVSYPTLLGLYHDRTKMYRADVLEKVCHALRCQPGDLLRRTPGKQPLARRRKKQ
jgi:putative transcriptional regulator